MPTKPCLLPGRCLLPASLLALGCAISVLEPFPRHILHPRLVRWCTVLALLDHNHYIRTEACIGGLTGELELPAKIDPHSPALGSRNCPRWISWCGALCCFHLLFKQNVMVHWWRRTSPHVLSTPLHHLGQFTQDLFVSPSVATLGECDVVSSECQYMLICLLKSILNLFICALYIL